VVSRTFPRVPAEAVTLLVAVATPLVAGGVAIVIHRQRLHHERREADLAIVRALLSRGGTLLRALDDDAHCWFLTLRPGAQVEVGKGRDLFAVFSRSQFAWRNYVAGELDVMFEAQDAVMVTANEIVSAAAELAAHWADWQESHPEAPMRSDAFRGAMGKMHRFVQAVPRWNEAATAVARARL
jgi:hypothetical protein